MSDTTKTIPISGRIAQEDYEFLMAYAFGGKVTASEKLRHMASFFRNYHQNLGDFTEGLEELNRLLEPARKNLKRLENAQGTHSEVIDQATNILPQALAFLISRQQPVGEKQAMPYLLETEERLLLMSLRLVEHILRLGLTRQAPAYNPHLLEDKLNAIIELVGLISSSQQKSQNPNSNETI